jgi:hypothetical protein
VFFDLWQAGNVSSSHVFPTRMMSLYRNLQDPPIWPYLKAPLAVTFIQITYRYTSGSYLRENTVRVPYKYQSVNAVQENTQNLLQDLYKKHK